MPEYNVKDDTSTSRLNPLGAMLDPVLLQIQWAPIKSIEEVFFSLSEFELLADGSGTIPFIQVNDDYCDCDVSNCCIYLL